jgi:putative selenate reductase
LISPLKINSKDGKVISLLCEKMKLGEKDSGGRARPISIPNSEFEIKADAIIPAFGQDVVLDFVDMDLIKTKPNSYETRIPNVFIGGDALRGGSTVIHAVGDGRKVAEKIIEKITNVKPKIDVITQKDITTRDIKIKKTKKVLSKADYHSEDAGTNNFNIISNSLTKEQAIEEASRCLYCDVICDVCTSVCPNLALYPFEIEPKEYNTQKLIVKDNNTKIVDKGKFSVSQKHQILHLADWCNECGNCDTFCPSSGAPYEEKPHLYLDLDTFKLSNDSYYIEAEKEKELFYINDGIISSLIKNDDEYIYRINKNSIKLNANDFSIISYDLNENDKFEIDLKQIAEMSVILQGAIQLLG